MERNIRLVQKYQTFWACTVYMLAPQLSFAPFPLASYIAAFLPLLVVSASLIAPLCLSRPVGFHNDHIHRIHHPEDRQQHLLYGTLELLINSAVPGCSAYSLRTKH